MTDELKPTPESVTPEVTPEAEMVPKANLDEVVRESIGRKTRIKELEAQLEKITALAPEGKTAEEIASSFTTQINRLKEENQKLNAMGTLRDGLSKRGVLDGRVAELVYADPKTKTVLGSPELLESFLDQWKTDNFVYFKQEAKQPIVVPNGQPIIPATPKAMTPNEELEAFKKMPIDEKMRIPHDQREKLMKLILGQLSK